MATNELMILAVVCLGISHVLMILRSRRTWKRQIEFDEAINLKLMSVIKEVEKLKASNVYYKVK